MSSKNVSVFGLDPRKGRWIFVVAGFVINIALGTIYAYSVISVHLLKYFKSLGLNPTATEMQLPFIVFFAVTNFIVMPLAGRLIDRLGPRVPAVAGGIATGLAWIGASAATSPAMLTVLYGVIGGVGLGLAYNAPISTVSKWFPDRRGLAVGLTVAGFGLSAAITGPLLDMLIASYGLHQAFRIAGVLFAATIVSLGLLLHFPPQEWALSTGLGLQSRQSIARDYSPREMVRTSSFWGLWLCFAIGTLAGLLAIGVAKPVGLEIAERSGLRAEEVSSMLTLLMIPFAASNTGGRPLFGWAVDRLGPRKAALLSYTLIAAASASLYLYPAIPVYIASFAVLWMSLGAWMAIAPAVTAQFFGTRYYGANYGIVLTAYGVGAITGNVLAGMAKDVFGYYTAAMPYVAALAVIGMVIDLALLKPPRK
jgi:MFS family permease